MASLSIQNPDPAQLWKLEPSLDIQNLELLGVREPESVVLVFFVKDRVSRPAGKEILEGLVEVAQGLLKAVTRSLTYPGDGLLQAGQFSALGSKSDRMLPMPPGHGPLLQGQIPYPSAGAGCAGAKGRLLFGEVQPEAMAFENEHGENIANLKILERKKSPPDPAKNDGASAAILVSSTASRGSPAGPGRACGCTPCAPPACP